VSKAKRLQSVPPANRSPQELLLWVQDQAQQSSAICNEAKQHYERLQKYHQTIAELVGEMVTLSQSSGNDEAIAELADAAGEVISAVMAINSDALPSSDAVAIEVAEKELFGDDLDQINREFHGAKDRFLAAYNKHKDRLGLSTRDQVSKMTGINPRYISEFQ
jgi:hypothetical protein